jgi:divalent metal cation (Fe/Co/Zn/Cd) transporter
VLGIAALFEGISFLIGLKTFRRQARSPQLWQSIKASKDPTSFIVVLEDSAALAGIAVAAIGISLAHALAMPALDGVASIAVGLILCFVAAILARETWSLLVGESAAPELVKSIQSIAASQPGVRSAQMPRTMHMGPETVHVDLDIDVDTGRPGAQVVQLARDIENAIKKQHPVIKRVSLRFPTE